MPPFRYEQFESPYVQEIARMMQQGAAIQGRAALQAGDAQAQALQVGGQATARTLGSIGQGVGEAAQNYQQIQQKKQQAMLAQVLTRAARPDGTYDRSQVRAGLEQTGLSGQWPTLSEWLDKNEQAALTREKTRAEIDAPIKLSAGESLADRGTGRITTTAPNPAAEEAARHNTAQEEIALRTADRTEGTAAETARHNKALEDIGRLTAGRAEATQVETARHNKTMEGLASQRLAATTSQGALPISTQRRVDVKSRAFEALPVVKRTQMMAESVGFAKALDVNTQNPADDQALIYAFAKAMDPDSVVREGEYATVQKYAQSWAQSFGFNAARVFSNTTFLTAAARQNMKATIQTKFGAAKQQYDVVRKSYVDQINKVTGQANGEEYLTDFGGAFPTATPPASTTPTKIGRFDVQVEP